jgi:hypothetical protein
MVADWIAVLGVAEVEGGEWRGLVTKEEVFVVLIVDGAEAEILCELAGSFDAPEVLAVEVFDFV